MKHLISCPQIDSHGRLPLSQVDWSTAQNMANGSQKSAQAAGVVLKHVHGHCTSLRTAPKKQPLTAALQRLNFAVQDLYDALHMNNQGLRRECQCTVLLARGCRNSRLDCVDTGP